MQSKIEQSSGYALGFASFLFSAILRPKSFADIYDYEVSIASCGGQALKAPSMIIG